jgi:hypothetical protein
MFPEYLLMLVVFTEHAAFDFQYLFQRGCGVYVATWKMAVVYI